MTVDPEMTRSVSTAAEGDRVRLARRGVAVFLGVVLVVSGVIEGIMLVSGRPINEQLLMAAANMWVPTLASIVARLSLREGFGDVSFRFRFRGVGREWLIAWLFPLLVGIIAYGSAWLTGLEQFRAPTLAQVGLEHLPASWRVVVAFSLALSISPLLGALTAAGEEFGWRGYLLTRLIDARCPRPVMVSGLIWSAWHSPMIFAGIYAAGQNVVASVLLFTISMTAGSYVYARVRLATGSVWTAVLLHSSWNALILGPFLTSTVGASAARGESIWVGESGVLVVATSVVAAIVVSRRPVRMRRAPRDEPGETLPLLSM